MDKSTWESQVVTDQPVSIYVQPAPIYVQPAAGVRKHYRLPYMARTLSVVFLIFCGALLWIPGLIGMLTALILAIMGIEREKKNDRRGARALGIASLIMVGIGIILYPVLVLGAVLGTVFGYMSMYMKSSAGIPSGMATNCKCGHCTNITSSSGDGNGCNCISRGYNYVVRAPRSDISSGSVNVGGDACNCCGWDCSCGGGACCGDIGSGSGGGDMCNLGGGDCSCGDIGSGSGVGDSCSCWGGDSFSCGGGACCGDIGSGSGVGDSCSCWGGDTCSCWGGDTCICWGGDCNCGCGACCGSI